MTFNLKYDIIPRYLPQPSARRRGYAMIPGVRFIVAHDTGNPNTTASQNVAYYHNNPNPTAGAIASAHLFVDDKQIIECIPVMGTSQEKAWHVLYTAETDQKMFGHHANDAAIGIEYCYGTAIDADQAYARYVWLMAYACQRFQLAPSTSIVGHHILDPQRKTDPQTGLMQSRRSYEQLLRDVVIEYTECGGQVLTTPTASSHPGPDVPPQSGRVVSTTRLHIRKGAPNTRAAIVRIAAAGASLAYVAKVKNGEPVNGNPIWYEDPQGNYFWGGSVIVER